MKNFTDSKVKDATKIYFTGLAIFIILLFLLTGVIFLWICADKLDIIFNQKIELTCTYFVSILDRVLLVLLAVLLFPLTLYQILTKNETAADKIINYLSVCIFTIFCLVFIGGEYHYFNLYKSGSLKNSPMFSKQTIETKVFDLILKK